MNLNEKKELVVSSYSSTFDKDMAYVKADVSHDEMVLLDGDYDFQQRLKRILIREREKVIENFRDFMDSEDERIAFNATKELAKMIYPDFMEGIRKDEKKPPTKLEDLDMVRLSDEELMEIAVRNRPKVITDGD